ncbi:MAG TPA: NAD(P)-binding protein [Mycobacterium sp.]|nr:NAD(P)-binding protein [Mycobacterium sp.]
MTVVCNTIEADYLVIGAGAMGVAFIDTLVSETDARVVLVDRYHQPGGHWPSARAGGGEVEGARSHTEHDQVGAVHHRDEAGPVDGRRTLTCV